MFYSLLAFFVFQLSAKADFHAETEKYEYSEKWKENSQIKVLICNWQGNKINNKDVLDAINFWNKKQNRVRITNLYKVGDCDLRSKSNKIIISDMQNEINRQKEYGAEITYTKKGTDIITKSYIEINTGSKISLKERRKTIFHELGHALGIKHCNNCTLDDIMNH